MISLTYILTPKEYGSWVIITQIVMLSAMVSSLGIDAAITTEYHEHSDNRHSLNELISSIFGFRIIFAIFAGLFWVILTENIFFSFEGSIFEIKSDLVLLSAVMGVYFAVINSSLSLFRIQERAVRFVAIQIVHPVFFFAGIILLTFHLEALDLNNLALVYFFCAIIVTTIVSIVVFSEFGTKLVSSRVIVAIKRDFSLIFYSLASWSLVSLDRFVIEFFDSLEAVAIYSLAYSSAIIYIPLASVLDNVFSPIFYSNASGEEKVDMKKLTMTLIKILMILTIIVNLVALAIVEFFAPQEYSEGVWVVPWIVLAGFVQSIQFIFVKPLFYTKKSHLIALLCLISAFTNLVLNVALVPKFGYNIAAFTTLVSYTLSLYGVVYFSKRYFEYGVSRKFLYFCLLAVFFSTFTIFSSFVYLGPNMAFLSGLIILISYFLTDQDLFKDSNILFSR